MSVDGTVRTYDPKKVVFVFGAIIATGYAEGEFIKIERMGDIFATVKGADGGIDRINLNNLTYEVELTLKQTSPTNEELSIATALDITANSGVATLIVKDLSGNSLFTAPQAWVKKDPESTYSDGMGNRTWTFATGASGNLIGKNN